MVAKVRSDFNEQDKREGERTSFEKEVASALALTVESM